ncbi:MAG: hypothetical protein H6R10_633 [Rhodocyclaceae bacterium]|nr:hypothetical protein [Rhodocyclaceae bacterium]
MTQVIPETIPDYDQTRITERPDGFYWQSKGEEKEYGPFPTLLEAVQDMQYRDSADLGDLEPEETLEEAESDIGIADWIDEETGEPAEEHPPRLDEH